MASKTLARAIPGLDVFGVVEVESDRVFATPTGLGTIAGSLFVARPDSVAHILPLSVCMFNRPSNCIHLLAARPHDCHRVSNLSDLTNHGVKLSCHCQRVDFKGAR
jgi:hypothetical protein